MTRPLPDHLRKRPYKERNSPWQPTNRQIRLLGESPLTAKELAAQWGITPNTCRRWRRNIIKSIREQWSA